MEFTNRAPKTYYGSFLNAIEKIKTIKKLEPQLDASELEKEQFERYIAFYPSWSKEQKEASDANIQVNIKLFTSDLTTIYKKNRNRSSESLSLGVYLSILESIGTMLLGMALFKLGFFEFELKKYIYSPLIFNGIPLGAYLCFLLYVWNGLKKTELIALYSWKTFSAFMEKISQEKSARICCNH